MKDALKTDIHSLADYLLPWTRSTFVNWLLLGAAVILILIFFRFFLAKAKNAAKIIAGYVTGTRALPAGSLPTNAATTAAAQAVATTTAAAQQAVTALAGATPAQQAAATLALQQANIALTAATVAQANTPTPAVLSDTNNGMLWKVFTLLVIVAGGVYIFLVTKDAILEYTNNPMRSIRAQEAEEEKHDAEKTSFAPAGAFDPQRDYEIVKGLSNAYDIPLLELSELLTKSGGSVADEFRKNLFNEYGIILPKNLMYSPKTISQVSPADVPKGLRVKVKLRKVEWCRPLSTNGWAASYEPPLAFDPRFEYLFDCGTDAETRMFYDKNEQKRKVSKDGKLGEILPPNFGGVSKVQLRLPRTYNIPIGVSEVEVTVVRRRVQ